LLIGKLLDIFLLCDCFRFEPCCWPLVQIVLVRFWRALVIAAIRSVPID
jgi:hypothetical protein